MRPKAGQAAAHASEDWLRRRASDKRPHERVGEPRLQPAREAYQRTLEIERDHRGAVASLADVYPRLGRHAEGAFWRSRTLTLAGQTELAAAFDDVRQRQGPKQALDWLDRHTLAEFERAPDEHLWDLAYTHARLGHAEEAFQFLQRACERREPGMLQARVDRCV
jgi:hypothetical protein